MKTIGLLLGVILVSGCSHLQKNQAAKQVEPNSSKLQIKPKIEKPKIIAGSTYYSAADFTVCGPVPGRSGPCTYALSRGHTIHVEKLESPDGLSSLFPKATFRCDDDAPGEANCGIEEENWSHLLPASQFERAALITQNPEFFSSASGPIIQVKTTPRTGQILFVSEKAGQYLKVLLPDQSSAWIKDSSVSLDPKVVAAGVVMEHLYSLKKDALEWGATSKSMLSNGCTGFDECANSLIHEGTFYFVSLLRNEVWSYLLEKNRLEKQKQQEVIEAKEEADAWRKEREIAYTKMTPEERNEAEAEDNEEPGAAADDNETPLFVVPTVDIYKIKWP